MILIIFSIVCHPYNCIVWTVNYITFSLSDLHVKPQVVLLPTMCTRCCLSGSTWAATALRKEMAQGWQSQRTVAFCPELWNEGRACWVLQTFIMTLDIPPSLPQLSSFSGKHLMPHDRSKEYIILIIISQEYMKSLLT